MGIIDQNLQYFGFKNLQMCLFVFQQLQTAYNVKVHHSGQLLINNVQDTDAGAYKCVATNDAGSDSATVNLEVGCKSSSDWLLR